MSRKSGRMTVDPNALETVVTESIAFITAKHHLPPYKVLPKAENVLRALDLLDRYCM